MHRSISTIDNPEFINLKPNEISPLISSCDIKVFYLGENRNKTNISKTAALEMAKSLRGNPIVGHYRKDAEDFGDHGQRVVIDGDGVKFECLTQPYGFVAPDAEVWFQKFEEQSPTGETIVREYLMTQGYLWTGQYQEAKQIFDDGGKGQSMEIEDVNGSWYTKENGIDFFIINDALFSKLCILGDDVEPCFEGANITKSGNYTLMEKSFTTTLYTMMSELKEILGEGGKTVKEELNMEAAEFTAETPESTPVEQLESAEFKKNDDDDDKDKENDNKDTDDNKEDNSSDDKNDDKDKNDEDDEKKKKFELLEQELNELKNQYSALENKYNELVEYKRQAEEVKKDELIESFYWLSDEDKSDVIKNKENYSLDDIEAKLSIVSVRNHYDLSLGKDKEKEEKIEDKPEVVQTYSLSGNGESYDNVAPWIKACQEIKE